MIPKCPKCGSRRMHVAIHTMYVLEKGHWGGVTTDGPEENLQNSDYTVCAKCYHDGKFCEFEQE